MPTYLGEPPLTTAARSVLREIPSVLVIGLIGNPSARSNRRISAKSSTDSNSLPVSADAESQPKGSEFNCR